MNPGVLPILRHRVTTEPRRVQPRHPHIREAYQDPSTLYASNSSTVTKGPETLDRKVVPHRIQKDKAIGNVRYLNMVFRSGQFSHSDCSGKIATANPSHLNGTLKQHG